jgi:hypothetical protein
MLANRKATGDTGGMDTDAQPEPAAAPKPPRRCFQYSTRALLLLTLVCAAGLGPWVNAARRQRRAVEYLESRGGYVLYARQGGVVGRHAPRWVQQMLGKDFFLPVTSVRLQGEQVDEAGLDHLAGLTGLKSLGLHNTRVSDAGLAHLAGLTGLEGLVLNGSPVGDAGMGHLRGLRGLRSLYVRNTQVGDAGLKQLEGLTQLNSLYLANTLVSDAGLTHLERMQGLKQLWLRGTLVSEAGAAQLRQALPDCKIVY